MSWLLLFNRAGHNKAAGAESIPVTLSAVSLSNQSTCRLNNVIRDARYHCYRWACCTKQRPRHQEPLNPICSMGAEFIRALKLGAYHMHFFLEITEKLFPPSNLAVVFQNAPAVGFS